MLYIGFQAQRPVGIAAIAPRGEEAFSLPPPPEAHTHVHTWTAHVMRLQPLQLNNTTGVNEEIATNINERRKKRETPFPSLAEHRFIDDR